jgi:hypothetical protein
MPDDMDWPEPLLVGRLIAFPDRVGDELLDRDSIWAVDDERGLKEQKQRVSLSREP